MKLVRDHIPKIIRESGKRCLCRTVSDKKEHLTWLLKKMVEETNEFIENPSYEEAADIFEVLRTLTELYSLDMGKVHAAADDKRKERGGFIQGVILEVAGEHPNDDKI